MAIGTVQAAGRLANTVLATGRLTSTVFAAWGQFIWSSWLWGETTGDGLQGAAVTAVGRLANAVQATGSLI